MKVYIGFDAREEEAAHVAASSLRDVSGLEAEFLCLPKLRDHGLLTRPVDTRGGQDFDILSGEHTSTQFNISRFLTPMLCQQGFALFVDCDVVFYRDPIEALREVKAEHAVSVVQHGPLFGDSLKMVSQKQSYYERKNWSSVMLFNCDHPANRRLTLADINTRPKQWLHQLQWLADTEVGALGPEWNWLVNVEPMPTRLGIAHFTLGGPWLQGWQAAEYDALWRSAADRRT